MAKKITFVCIGSESLGIEYLSSVLKQKGHKVNLVFDPSLFDDKYWLHIPFLYKLFDKKKKIIDKIINSKPDFIAFSVITDTYQRCCQLAKELKKRSNAKIIFGGIHPTSVPEQVIMKQFVDYVVVGEGEDALLDLVEGKQDAGNIWFKNNNGIVKNEVRPLIKNLDEIPFPDKELFNKYIPHNKSYSIMTSRDCPFNCHYCCNSILHRLYGFLNRKRSPQNVLEELKWAKERFNFKQVFFLDDTFSSNK
ncbi:MAG: cobalamin-dependent protein, partial [Candidatus Omnitrophica bacterium]|nr:cobalamin-dependent protein [Candidatus Omnitrophota bacterium]